MTYDLSRSPSISPILKYISTSYVAPEDSSPSSMSAYLPGLYGSTSTSVLSLPGLPQETDASPSWMKLLSNSIIAASAKASLVRFFTEGGSCPDSPRRLKFMFSPSRRMPVMDQVLFVPFQLTSPGSVSFDHEVTSWKGKKMLPIF